jgi:hypothetical protein
MTEQPWATTPTTVSITCLNDGLAHDVPDTELSGPMGTRAGCYSAVCGHLVVAGSMVEPEGRACPLCSEIVGRRRGRVKRRWV